MSDFNIPKNITILSNVVNNSSSSTEVTYSDVYNKTSENSSQIDNNNIIEILDNALNMAQSEDSIKVFLEMLKGYTFIINENLFKLYRDKAFNKLNSVKNSDTHTNK